MIHGWAGSGAYFKHQFDAFTQNTRVIALDCRGCGQSEKPDYGYRVSRYAADLRDLMAVLDIEEADLLGHSMGATVIWSYLDLFGHEGRARRLILVDGTPPCPMPKPGWDQAEMDRHGVLIPTYQAFANMYESAQKTKSLEEAKANFAMFVSDQMPEEDISWLAQNSLAMPGQYAADILADVAGGDWRDVPRRTKMPTLAVTCRGRPSSELRHKWLAGEMPHAQIEYFNPDEGGSHCMFFENPKKFNAIVLDFLKRTA